MSEQEILDLYLARNEEAVRKSEETYGAYCHTIAYRILRDEGEAAVSMIHGFRHGARYRRRYRTIWARIWRKSRAICH